jgi:hypothetical protein
VVAVVAAVDVETEEKIEEEEEEGDEEEEEDFATSGIKEDHSMGVIRRRASEDTRRFSFSARFNTRTNTAGVVAPPRFDFNIKEDDNEDDEDDGKAAADDDKGERGAEEEEAAAAEAAAAAAAAA